MVEVIGDGLTPSFFDATAIAVANSSGTTSLTNVAPWEVETATVSKWLKVIVEGVEYFIPMWT